MKIFLSSAIKRLLYYHDLGNKTFNQLSEEDFHCIAAKDSNSVAVIIQHMHGNMMSRWTNFMTTDGEKKYRQRNAEFEDKGLNKSDLLILWEQGWKCFIDVLKSLTENDLLKTLHIRSVPLTVIEAINRQVAHYPFHVGQIIYVGKLFKKESWKNLSVPKKKN